MQFQTITADPPWDYGSGQPRGVFTQKKDGTTALGVNSKVMYGAMSMEEICAIKPPAADSSHLYLWTTNAFMVEAHTVAKSWGFKPKTILTWVKTHKDDRSRVSMKTGYYFRGASEHCIFAVRGSLRLNSTSVGYPTAYLWPRLPHSVKPDAFYDLVEACSPGPYLELFSRRARLGWHSHGDQSLEEIAV